MRLVIDNREQAPLVFKHKSIKETIRGTLNVGDYAAIVDDYQLPFHFERKSINDLFSTLSQGYDRFKKEIARAREQNIKLIIIVEGSLNRVLTGTTYSLRSPESVVYQLFTLRARYNIETVFCNNREESAEYITQFFIAYSKDYLEKKIINE